MSFFSSIFNFVNSSGNLLLVLLFLAAAFGYGMALGKNRLNLVTIAIYFSLAITKSIPWSRVDFLATKDGSPNTNIQIFIFLAIILAIFFLGPHSALGSTIKISGRGRASWWQLTILGALQLGLLASIIISFLPPKIIADLDPLIKQFFISAEAQFLWLFLPIAAMFILKKRRKYGAREEE
ncbi:MAG: hypothetical protein HY764_01595 [Candidatus Portnoybacteria bacterium]|nr:hypothetical protein [Candidatus Portnoybacteria bacterium]